MHNGSFPQTFDGFNLMLLISGTGILAAVYGRKNKHKEHEIIDRKRLPETAAALLSYRTKRSPEVAFL